jgi:hypothetical protein
MVPVVVEGSEPSSAQSGNGWCCKGNANMVVPKASSRIHGEACWSEFLEGHRWLEGTLRTVYIMDCMPWGTIMSHCECHVRSRQTTYFLTHRR